MYRHDEPPNWGLSSDFEKRHWLENVSVVMPDSLPVMFLKDLVSQLNITTFTYFHDLAIAFLCTNF